MGREAEETQRLDDEGADPMFLFLLEEEIVWSGESQYVDISKNWLNQRNKEM